ncbi:MAG: hypothetical protein E7553_04455 [Ruminococcaceae bacterium]|nr:hypothetical protein [Oscillospiraceae bacterium]
MKRMICGLLAVWLLCSAVVVPAVSAEAMTTYRAYLGGDINGDWALDTSDVREMLSAILSETTLPSADVNGDSIVNTADAKAILKTVSKGTTVYPVEAVFAKRSEPLQGQDVTFVHANADIPLADYTPSVWVVQSVEELRAALSLQKYMEYDETTLQECVGHISQAFFEDHVLIVLDTFYNDVNSSVRPSRIVKSDNELCIVLECEMAWDEPLMAHDRFLLEVARADLENVQTITTYAEYIDVSPF